MFGFFNMVLRGNSGNEKIIEKKKLEVPSSDIKKKEVVSKEMNNNKSNVLEKKEYELALRKRFYLRKDASCECENFFSDLYAELLKSM